MMMNAEHFIRKLQDLNALLHKESAVLYYNDEDIKEYSLRCELQIHNTKCGNVIIYYSPKKKRFKASISSIGSQVVYDILAQNVDEVIEKLPKKTHKVADNSPQGLFAYVDGSFSNNIVTFGAVILDNNELVTEFSGKVLEPSYQHARQVAGELMAVGKVIQWCLSHNCHQIAIHYDYEGIEHWVTGKWKAKQLLTQRYRDYVQNSGVSIHWVKVAAHTGVYWNEYVDKLAKQAAI